VASGTAQLYAWDALSGTRRQLTYSQEGIFEAMLALDGCFTYYLRDGIFIFKE
jgi:hypothetical protein